MLYHISKDHLSIFFNKLINGYEYDNFDIKKYNNIKNLIVMINYECLKDNYDYLILDKIEIIDKEKFNIMIGKSEELDDIINI